jgi:hypothetical protein
VRGAALMAKRKGGTTACPVPGCGRKDFANKGAAASHVRLAKDSLHVAHRSSPPAAVSDASEPAVPPEPAPAADPAPVESAGVPVVASSAPATPPEEKSEPAGERAGTVVVSFQPPSVVQPLAGTDQQKASSTAEPSPTGEQAAGALTMKSPTVSDVPLEPFLAQAVASALNAFALDPSMGDKLLDRQAVANTGFPKALELSVRKYWPNLPLDHPAVLLCITGTSLVTEVKKCRAPRPRNGKPAKKRPVVQDQGDASDDPPATLAEVPPPAAPASGPPKAHSKEASLYASMLAEVQS